MRDIILCIDDDPKRYEWIIKTNSDWTILVTCRLEEVEFYLHFYKNRIWGVCLDHDMPGPNGQYFAQHVLNEYSFPVVIVSNNIPGANKICEILDEWAVPYTRIPASAGIRWGTEVLGYFRRQNNATHSTGE